MNVIDPPESDMLGTVLRLFPERKYRRYPEAGFGRKRIDLICVPRCHGEPSVSVELKIRDWKQALWQASHNFHVAELSYVAIWHRYVSVIERNLDLFDNYGVGVINVSENSAHILHESKDRVQRIAREYKADFYKQLANSV